jgi:hypothetical protein
MALVRTMHDVDYKEQDTLVSLKTALDWRACAMRVVIKKMATCELHTVDIPTSASINCTLKNAKTPIAIVMILNKNTALQIYIYSSSSSSSFVSLLRIEPLNASDKMIRTGQGWRNGDGLRPVLDECFPL